MIPKECKRLAEVDFPIAVVSKYSVKEKSIRIGHPSTLHLWWARRPLAACRGMLLGLLLPDPCDPYCPKEFKAKARELLPQIQGKGGSTDEDLRKELLKFIGDFSNWELSVNQRYFEVGRELVKAAHGKEAPLVADPFAGGGSIPLEALRLGCEVFASDLNPVACLVLKVMLEDIPRAGPDLVEELGRIGTQIKDQFERELIDLYPKSGGGAAPIAYLWTRTVQCESPNCGAEIPLVRSFWLSKKANRKRALRHRVVRPAGGPPRVEFEVFEPIQDNDVPKSTVTRAKATCICCGSVLSPERVRAQLATQHGGADVIFNRQGKRIGGARMTAVVMPNGSTPGRDYRLPTESDYSAVWRAQERLANLLQEWEKGGRVGLRPIPDEPICLNEIRRVSVPLYGATTWGDIFTARQKASLYMYAKLIREAKSSEACSRLCSLALDRILILLSAHCRWKPSGETLIDMFGRHAIGMVWDFAESSPGFGSQSLFYSWLDKYRNIIQFQAPLKLKPGQVQQHDAAEAYLPDESCQIWFTDPPYYDSIPYAHLSDCFYVWLKRSVPKSDRLGGFSEPLSPKDAECVVDRPHRLSTSKKDEAYFERKMAEAATVGRKVLSASGCASIVFAHKTTEGWEALLSGIIGGGWCITASWPIATELTTRLNARDTASLATSVHLICRPRPDDVSVGDWSEVLHGNRAKKLEGLAERVGSWMERMQGEGVRGADLVFACIGPALEIYSRYRRVETADGREVKLTEYLEKVWEVVGRTALEQVLGITEANSQNGSAGTIEEDARLTALFLWTLQSSNGESKNDDVEEISETGGSDEEDEEESAKPGKAIGYTLVFDVVRRFAQPLGIDLPKWEGRVVETTKGVVRLLPVTERARILFREEGVHAMAEKLEKAPAGDILQGTLFPEFDIAATPKRPGPGRTRKALKISVSDDRLDARLEATTLDRVHVAMLLQASGRANALRSLLKAEQDRGPDFLRLANALSALYPKGSEEKRLLDAMLLAVPR